MAALDAAQFVAIPKPYQGRILTVLSIDGGGIRGLIPATILEYLEEKLQVRNDKHLEPFYLFIHLGPVPSVFHVLLVYSAAGLGKK